MNKSVYEVKYDLYDIVDRLKAIDENYFIVRNFVKHRYEIHYKRNKNTFELVIPFGCLDSRTIDLVLKTRIENRKKLLEEMEKQNEKVQKQNEKTIKEKIMEKLEQ